MENVAHTMHKKEQKQTDGKELDRMGKKGTGEVMTQQQKQRNDAYNAYVEQVTPTHNLWANMGKAFVLGGAICLLGQVITAIAMNVFALNQESASMWCSLLLVLLSVILTSCNVYGLLANWGGAGALVPITGFANGVCASAVEFQKEGQVFGTGCQIFKIAGPVILYGIFSSWVLGVIYWIIQLF